MAKNKKADPVKIGSKSKTDQCCTNNERAFSIGDFKTFPSSIQCRKCAVYGKRIEQIELQCKRLAEYIDRCGVKQANDAPDPGTHSSREIECYECKVHSEVDGYRFRLVPLCRYCRTDRELQMTHNRFERRHRR